MCHHDPQVTTSHHKSPQINHLNAGCRWAKALPPPSWPRAPRWRRSSSSAAWPPETRPSWSASWACCSRRCPPLQRKHRATQSGWLRAAWWRCWRPMRTVGCWGRRPTMRVGPRPLLRPMRHMQSACSWSARWLDLCIIGITSVVCCVSIGTFVLTVARSPQVVVGLVVRSAAGLLCHLQPAAVCLGPVQVPPVLTNEKEQVPATTPSHQAALAIDAIPCGGLQVSACTATGVAACAGCSFLAAFVACRYVTTPNEA